MALTVRDIRVAPPYLFAEGDRNVHVAAAQAILRGMAEAFPDAGIALGGSVGAGTHGPASDVDMIVTDAAFRWDAQLSAKVNGVAAAVVCLRPTGGMPRVRRWALQAAGEARLVTMVRSARVLHDPCGAFADLQAEADASAALRNTDATALATSLALLIQSTTAQLRAAPEARANGLSTQLALLLLEHWTLQRGAGDVRTKADERRIRDAMAGDDPIRYAMLTNSAHPDRRAALIAAADQVCP